MDKSTFAVWVAVFFLLSSTLALIGCAPPGMDPKIAESFRQRCLASNDERIEEAKTGVSGETSGETGLGPLPTAQPMVAIPPTDEENITVVGVGLTGYWALNTFQRMSFEIGPFNHQSKDLGPMDIVTDLMCAASEDDTTS
jgi:hypothetical protein